MPFQAQCLFCGQKVKVPDRALGTSGRCPKCSNFFTLVPGGEEAPALEKAGPLGRRLAKTATKTPRPPTVSAPKPVTAAMPSRTSIGPDSVEDAEQTRPWIEPIGLCALLLSGAALLCASSPASAKLVIWLSILALLAGLVGLLRVLVTGSFRLAMPIAAVAASGSVFFIALCAPSFLGPIYAASREGETIDPTVIRVVPIPGKAGVGSTGPEWADASQAALQQGGLRVQVMSAGMDAKNKEATAKRSPEDTIVVRLRIQHVETTSGADSPRFSPEKTGYKLTDNTGKAYRLLDVREAIPTERKVFPVALTDHDIVVEAPGRHIDYLRLEIPARGSGMFRFQIPGTMIRRDRAAGLAGGRD